MSLDWFWPRSFSYSESSCTDLLHHREILSDTLLATFIKVVGCLNFARRIKQNYNYLNILYVSLLIFLCMYKTISFLRNSTHIKKSLYIWGSENILHYANIYCKKYIHSSLFLTSSAHHILDFIVVLVNVWKCMPLL